MEKVPVSVGDMLFVDAGTVHAIGPGVVLLETQQTSDVTYRLYDYGRPRELHLEQGLKVIRQKTQAGKVTPKRDGWIHSADRAEVFCGGSVRGASGEVKVGFDGPGVWLGWAGVGWCGLGGMRWS